MISGYVIHCGPNFSFSHVQWIIIVLLVWPLIFLDQNCLPCQLWLTSFLLNKLIWSHFLFFSSYIFPAGNLVWMACNTAWANFLLMCMDRELATLVLINISPLMEICCNCSKGLERYAWISYACSMSLALLHPVQQTRLYILPTCSFTILFV